MIHSSRPWRVLWAISLLPALALAQVPGQNLPRVADPEAPVPTTPYRSALAGLPVGVETGSTGWSRANAEVGQFPRGHADILKWEAQQAAQPTASPPGTSSHHRLMHPSSRTPSVPAQAPATSVPDHSAHGPGVRP
jgi:hypothetical protein